jgi:hypothetical protein
MNYLVRNEFCLQVQDSDSLPRKQLKKRGLGDNAGRYFRALKCLHSGQSFIRNTSQRLLAAIVCSSQYTRLEHKYFYLLTMLDSIRLTQLRAERLNVRPTDKNRSQYRKLLSRDRATTDGVWIGNRIYWTL